MADTDTIYRVLKVPESLLTAMRKERDDAQTTNAQFLAGAVDDHLPRLVSDLQRLGFTGREETRRAARLPFSDDDATLGRLREASESVGLPTTKLLELCLVAAVRPPESPKPRRRRRTQSKETTKRKSGRSK